MNLNRFLVAACLVISVPCGPAWGASEPFPDVTPEQQALVAVAGHPEAPAVVLDKRARLSLTSDGRSTLDVWVRSKVLTEDGKAFGQAVVSHGTSVRLARFEGRTIRANGEVVTLPGNAVFEEERVGGMVAKAAFPAVEVGAIIDYRFQLRWDSIYFLEPWYLDDQIPTLRSELVYVEPAGLRVRHALRDPGRGRVRSQERTSPYGREVTLVGEDLPAVLEEPYGPVFADLALRVMVIPEARRLGSGATTPLLDRWRSVAVAAGAAYDSARQSARRARRLAKEKTKTLDNETDRANALLALVRERVRVTDGPVFVEAGASLDKVLSRGVGTHAEVALLLQTMLEAAGVAAQIAWAGDWRGGFPDLDIVNPGWFTKTLVRTTHDGRWLDPSDRRLAPGFLAPTQEGTDVLVVAGPKSEVVALPPSPSETSQRQVTLDLIIDTEGRTEGTGEMVLSGHHAWFYLDRFAAVDATRTAWEQWLDQRLDGFRIDRVKVREDRVAQTITVQWQQRQRAGSVLGDEVSLALSAPLGPLRQRYGLPVADRQTPVLLSFADVDEVTARIAWPDGWEPDVVPETWRETTEVGSGMVSFEVAADGRTATYRRRLQIDRTRVWPPDGYAALQSLSASMERSDAQPVVVIAE